MNTIIRMARYAVPQLVPGFVPGSRYETPTGRRCVFILTTPDGDLKFRFTGCSEVMYLTPAAAKCLKRVTD